MPSLEINGVTVEFPHIPYPCQLTYMTRVIECLEGRKYALLESPTGTGKTLCLLCAALAWREAQLSKLRGCPPTLIPSPDMPTPDASSLGCPRIIYASRTHAQLTQVVGELKSTAYRPLITVIGSREQLCINPQVTRLQNNADKVNVCRSKIKSRGCVYHNNMDKAKAVSGGKLSEEISDIEDLVMKGLRGGFCPYFMARELKEKADIVFMPYNYILDPQLRKANGVDLKNAIIILDEAHNVEKTCEEAASFELSSIDIAFCISDIDSTVKRRTDPLLIENREEEAAEELKRLLGMKSVLLEFEEHMDSIPVPSEGVTKPGNFIFSLFNKCGIRFETVNAFLDQMESIIALHTTDGEKFGFQRSTQSLQKFIDCVRIVFSELPRPQTDPDYFAKKLSRFYKVFVRKEVKQPYGEKEGWFSPGSREYKILSYWCFCAGAAIHDVIKREIWSLLLTSGTLSPLDAFSSELQIQFPIQLKNPHVISKEQVWIGIVKSGPDMVELSSAYHNRSNVAYKSSLGNAIKTFSRVIPKGSLVFFPSYANMYECMAHWKGAGIWNDIESSKRLFEEPKRKSEFNAVMDAFASTISDPLLSGAVFFGVCRGKVSEGMDFSDNNGRGVVITGLPYPPKNEPRVKLKMEFLDEAQNLKGEKFLTGKDWYQQQASRSVNQAIGRVIRHKKDFGAILLCDARFSYSGNISQLPSWLQSSVKVYGKFSEAIISLRGFFSDKNCEIILQEKRHSQSRALEFGTSKTNFVSKDRPKRKLEYDRNKFAKFSKVDSPKVEVSQEALKKLNGPSLQGSMWDNMKKIKCKNEIQMYSAPASEMCKGVEEVKNDLDAPALKQKAQNNKYKMMATKLVTQMDGDGQEFEAKPDSFPKIIPPVTPASDDSNKLELSEAEIKFKKERSARLIASVKADLTSFNYNRMTTAVKAYYRDRDGDSFTDELLKLFHDKALRHYLQDFERFLQPEHLAAYKTKCDALPQTDISSGNLFAKSHSGLMHSY